MSKKINKYISINIPQGKHIPTTEDYFSNLNPLGIKDDCRINQIGCITPDNEDILCIVANDDTQFSLLPGPEFSPRLYRGQPRFYEKCTSSLFRAPITQIKYLTALLKKYEFYKLMADHPIISYLNQWFIDGKQYKINMEGISGHYEFKTPMLDVTRSKDIAMFFALCERNKGQKYEPIMDENREVVLYTIDISTLLIGSNSDLNIVGFQALPRPDVQKAFTIIVGKDDNFNNYPYVNCEKFKVNREQSKKYFEMFEEGKILFPSDLVDIKAIEIQRSLEIDREVLEVCFEKHWIPKIWPNLYELCIFLNKHRYRIVDKNLKFSEEEKYRIIKQWNESNTLSTDRVKCRLVSPPR